MKIIFLIISIIVVAIMPLGVTWCANFLFADDDEAESMIPVTWYHTVLLFILLLFPGFIGFAIAGIGMYFEKRKKLQEDFLEGI